MPLGKLPQTRTAPNDTLARPTRTLYEPIEPNVEATLVDQLSSKA